VLSAFALLFTAPATSASQFVFAGNPATNNVSVLSFAADGSVTGHPSSPFPTAPGTAPRGLTMSADGRFLFLADSGSNQVASFSIAADGALTQVSGSPVASARAPSATAITPDGRFLYVTHGFFNDGLRSFSVGADGKLTALATTTMPGNGSGIAVSPDGQHLYAISTSGLFLFDIHADGSLTQVTGSPFIASLFPDSIAVAPSGGFAYVGSVTHDDIHALKLAADGTPTVVGGAVATGSGNANPQNVVVSPTGQRVYVVNTGPISGPDASAAAFSVAADGTLTPIGTNVSLGTTNSAGGGALSPDGRHFFAVRSNAGNNLESMLVGTDGALSAAPGSPFADGGTLGGTTIGFALNAVTPDQPPTASLSARPAAPGAATRFDGTRSTDPDGTVARYDWDFGDGTALANGGPTPTHTYARAGIYTASATLTDDIGCSDRMIWGSHIAYCNGGPSARATVTVDTPPAISRVSLTNRKFAAASARKRRVKRGTVIRYTLTENATVSFAIKRKTVGRRVSNACKKKTRKNARNRKCTRLVAAGSFRAAATEGANRTHFSGKIRGHKLRPGSYTLTATATDAGGAKSKPVTLSFRIVRG
jgi:6-phosphogluconolactonase (cycloisomerase 2 family)